MSTVRIEASATLTAGQADLIVAVVTQPFAGASALPFHHDANVRLIAEADRVGFDGALGQAIYVSGAPDAPWVAVIGAGEHPRVTDHRRVAARAIRLGRELKASAVAVAGVDGDAARYLAEGLLLSSYSFDRHKSAPATPPRTRLERALIVAPRGAGAVAHGLAVAESIVAARDLANEHPGVCTPTWLGERAVEIAARHGFEAIIKGEAELEREGFGLLLAVGRGSDEPSRLIHLIYRGAGPITRRLALVGKGVTFDSGGYSLKPREAITGMHLDMGGAAAVLGAADAIGRLKPAGVEVHFVVPSVENMVNGKAYKLNEVFKGYGGQTVEILNTDAEGRLILADAISYIAGFKPDEIIDLATLTGACVVALGLETAGLFASDDEVAQRLLAAAARADESIWRMPLTERIEDQLKSDVADMKNIGSRWGGAISAALFLKRFVTPGTPWMHLDIAGPAMAEAEWEYINRGGTGFGVATLVEYVEGLSRG